MSRMRSASPIPLSKGNACRVRVVSPDNTSSNDSGGFLDMLCFGGLSSLPSFCGEPDKEAVDTPNIIQEQVDFDAPSQLKASLKRVGSFKRSSSQKDLCGCSSDSVDQPQWRRRKQRQTNRDTRDPSPSIDSNYKQSSSDKSVGSRESDSPLLKDPPSTRRSRSVPLEKLLNNRKDRVAKNLQSSPSVGGDMGVTSSNSKLLPFALKHDEVVTSLIDDALQSSSDDSSNSASIDPKRTATYDSPLRKKNSPYRKKISTPQWLRNRSRKSDDERSVRGRFNSVNTADFFHPDCDLYKEKGSSKDSAPSAVGREAAVAKLMGKLSLLSEIESGKYGKGADMLRSDAIAIPIMGFMGLEAVETRSILTLRMGFVSLNYGIILQWDLASELAKQVVLVKMCRDDFLERSHIEFSNSGSHTVVTESDVEDENSTLIPDDSRTDNSPARALKTDISVGQAYLAVSILNVKQLAPKCDHTHHGTWPWSRAAEPEPESNSMEDYYDVQPYVRFVFGRNEHVTKSVKFDKGSITWNKRHRNSCLLPCPPEDQRWFAGQDDLIVEVRSKQRSSDDTSAGGRFTPMSFFKEETSSLRQKRNVSNDPLLAAVTVPLSSIIIDEEHDHVTSDGKAKHALSRVTRLFKKYCSETKDGPPSNYITLPLPMKCCPKAPFGSISLSITMKTPATYRGTPLLPTPSAKNAPSPQRKRALKTKVASHQQVEGIELMPLTSFISSWVNDDADVSSKNKNKATMSKVIMWTKRYDPRTKKWSNVNASIKKRRSFIKPTKKKHDESVISQVVDRVMGKEKVQKKKSLFSVKPATNAMHQARSDLNKSLHKVGDQVKERKKVVVSRINDSMQHIRQRPSQRAGQRMV